MGEVTREELAAMTGQELLAYERETSANPHFVSAVSIQFVRLVSHACELTLNAFEAGLPVARWYI